MCQGDSLKKKFIYTRFSTFLLHLIVIHTILNVLIHFNHKRFEDSMMWHEHIHGKGGVVNALNQIK